MRTNIVVDDSLMAEAMRLSSIKTKKGVIDQALRLLLQVLKKAQKRISFCRWPVPLVNTGRMRCWKSPRTNCRRKLLSRKP